MDRWIESLQRELDIDTSYDFDELLTVARIVAHRVERRATPVTTFLIGVAAGLKGGDASTATELSERVRALAQAWEQEQA